MEKDNAPPRLDYEVACLLVQKLIEANSDPFSKSAGNLMLACILAVDGDNDGTPNEC
jgi:hypothetical protein